MSEALDIPHDHLFELWRPVSEIQPLIKLFLVFNKQEF